VKAYVFFHISSDGLLDGRAYKASIPKEKRDHLAEKHNGFWELHDVPSFDDMVEQMMDGVCETPDGCWVEPDGHCPHGYPAWPLILGLI